MNTGWSTYVIVLTVVNMAACLWLIGWTAKKRPGEGGSSDTTGHVWDGITEYNKPMPRWWLNLFYLTLVFGAVYFVLYPGLGAYAGTQGWTSVAEHDADRAEAEARLAPLFARYRDVPLPELGADPAALALGRSVFANHCATCHGSDARGALGFPNLTDGDWLWGGTPEAVLQTIRAGRQAAMPALGGALGDGGVTEVAVYVQSLSGTPGDPALMRAGKQRYDLLCVACHGVDGRGNPQLGAPNLTDDIWLYGGSHEAIARSVREGRNGHMPPHGPILGEDRARLVAAWVLAQSATTRPETR